MALKKSKFVEKTVNILLNTLIVLFSIVLLISIYSLIQHKIFGNKYTNFFGYSTFEVQTNSMEDTINAGDWIIVKLTKKVNIKDIITYELKGEYITHRVIEAYKGTYITMGDANNAKDDPVDQSQVIGKTVKVLRGFGILRKTIFNLPVLITFIITLFLFNSTFKKDDAKSKLFEIVKSKIISKLFKNKKNIQKPVSIKRVEEQPIISRPEEQKIEEIETPKQEVEEQIETKIEESIKEEVKNEIIETPITLEKQSPEDLEKTMFHRLISVDLTELDDTRLEIAKTEMLQDTEPKKEEVVVNEPAPVVEEEKSLTDINLELIERRKNKNLVDAMINIKKEELNDIINTFLDDDKKETNEATIKNSLMTTYIHAKYYNYYNDIDISGRTPISKIEKVLKVMANELVQKYRGNDNKYSFKVSMYANIFLIIANIDLAKDTITDIKSKREFYKNEIIRCFKEDPRIEAAVNEIIKIQKSYAEIMKYLFKKLETNTFYLDYNKITSKKDLYAVSLEHNISFNKIYSDYIIDKTYTEGIIAEDKISVLFTLLLGQIMKDMIDADFERKYIVYLPSSIYKKEKKLWRLLRMIDDEYTKSHISLLITLKDLLHYKGIVKRIKKNGYKFNLVVDNESKINNQNIRNNLYLINSIFINKKNENYEETVSNIPGDLLDIVICDDIINKISDIGGDTND